MQYGILNGTLTVHIGGAIDHHTAREARETADKAITDTGAKKLILDLSEVDSWTAQDSVNSQADIQK